VFVPVDILPARAARSSKYGATISGIEMRYLVKNRINPSSE
jgi:hypothetical protein